MTVMQTKTAHTMSTDHDKHQIMLLSLKFATGIREAAQHPNRWRIQAQKDDP